jgi:hypothetical protein
MPSVTVGQDNSSPITIHYEDVGSGQPVVLIHGFPLSGRSWEKQIPPLFKDFYNLDEFLGTRISEEAVRDSWDVAAGASPVATYPCPPTRHTDFRADLAKIDGPTLVTHGTADRILPIEAAGARTHELVDDSHYVVIDGARTAACGPTPTRSTGRCSSSLLATVRSSPNRAGSPSNSDPTVPITYQEHGAAHAQTSRWHPPLPRRYAVA